MRLKFVILPLVLGMMSFLASCGSGGETAPTTDPATSPGGLTEPTPLDAAPPTGTETPGAAPSSPAGTSSP